MNTPWTDEEDAELKRMWMIEGLSASLCGDKLHRSRNSVIGRAHRLGWKRGRPTAPDRMKPYPQRISAPKITRAVGRGNAAGSRAALSIGQRKTATGGDYAIDLTPTGVLSPYARPWIERKAEQCAFPVGGSGADTMSCCNPTAGGTYCEGHRRIAYRPSETTKAYAPATERAAPKAKLSGFFSSWLEDAA